MENTTSVTKHLDSGINATRTVFNMLRVINDAQYDNNVDKIELIRLVRAEFEKYVKNEDAIFSRVAKELNDSLNDK
jgi:hypothetical protein